jgi:hypothetical protein
VVTHDLKVGNPRVFLSESFIFEPLLWQSGIMLNFNDFIMSIAETFKGLKTASGAVYHILTYPCVKQGSPVHEFKDWKYIYTHLGLDFQTVYCIEIDSKGFLLTTKTLSMRYVHDEYSTGRRIIEIKG